MEFRYLMIRDQKPLRGLPLLVSALVWLIACSGADKAPPFTVRDSAGVRIVESTRPAWDGVASWKLSEPVLEIGAVGHEAGGPPLYRVRDVTRLPDGRLALANAGTGEVLVYDSAGSLSQVLGGRGSGPGEFPRGPDWLQFIGPDTLLVVDRLGVRAVRFLTTGRHLATRAAPGVVTPIVAPDARMPDGRWLQFGEARSDGSDRVLGPYHSQILAVAASPDFESEDTLLTAPGADGVMKQHTWNGQDIVFNVLVPFGGRSYRSHADGRIAVGNGTAYNIAVRDLAGARYRIRRGVDTRPVTGRDVDGWLEESLGGITDPSTRANRRRLYEDVQAAGTHPAYVAFKLDKVGNLWVENYRPAGEGGPREWSIFGPAGQWLGDVELPKRLDVMEIGDGYLLGVYKDQLDVERIRLYRILKGIS